MTDLDSAVRELSVKLSEMTRRHDEKSALLSAVTECNPTMMWAKDTAGRYIFANGRHKDWLGIPRVDDVYGKTDIDFASMNRAIDPGNPRFHDFGEVCMNSDEITLSNMHEMRFLEAGNVRGEYCALQVFKAPLFDAKGTLVGTVGSAVDVTDRIQTRESMYAELVDLIDKHGIREPFKPIFDKFRAYCDRHRFYLTRKDNAHE